MDYQTRVTIDVTKALRDLNSLSKVMQNNDKQLNSLNTSINKLNNSLKSTSSSVKKIGGYINANNIFMKKAYGTSGLYNQRIKEGNVLLKKRNAALLANSRASIAAALSQKKFSDSIGTTNIFLRSQLIAFRAVMLLYSAWITAKAYIEFNKVAESIDLASRKLEMFTGSASSFEFIKEAAFKTGVEIDILNKIVTRLAITTDNAFSTKTLVKWTEGLVMSARAAGTSTMEMNNAMIQLSQSFSAGFLMGDEYRSISENLPLFKKALRDTADEAGHAATSLKELSSGRKIDIDLMTTALERLSEESAQYTFALDNIAAAEERVKVGWSLFANEVANSQFVKDTLNTIAGTFAYLSKDQKVIDVFNKQFPQLIESTSIWVKRLKQSAKTVGILATAIGTIIDALGSLYEILEKNQAILVGLVSGAVLFKIVKGLTLMGTTAGVTAVSVTGLNTAMAYLIAFATPLGILYAGVIALGAAFAGTAFAMKGWIERTIKAREELAELNRTLFESKTKMEKFMTSVKNIDVGNLGFQDLLSTMGVLEDSIDSMSKRLIDLGIQKQALIQQMYDPSTNSGNTAKRLQEVQDEIKNLNQGIFKSKQIFDAYGNKYDELAEKAKDAAKEFDQFTQKLTAPIKTKQLTEYLDKVEALEKASKKAIAGNVNETDVIKQKEAALKSLGEEFVKALAHQPVKVGSEEYILEKQLALQRKILAARDAEKKRLEDANKLLLRYHNIQSSIAMKAEKIENPFNLKIDTTTENTILLRQTERLNKIKKEGIITKKEYEKLMSQSKESINDLINLKQADHLESVAREYDDVAQAEYDLLKVETELKELKEKGIELNYSQADSLYELERAIIQVKSEAGQLTFGDQAFYGLQDGLYRFRDESKTVFEEISEITSKAFASMTDQLTEFVMTGKLDFSSLANSIIKDLVRIAIQKTVTEPLSSGLSFALDTLANSSSVASVSAYSGSDFGNISSDAMNFSSYSGLADPMPTFANGGAFNNGVQTFANGGVVSQPTFFPMSSGAGLMGEAGPEAIMPLSRGANGKLGVYTDGKKAGNTIVNINNYTNSQATTTENTDSQGNKTIDIIIEEKVNAAISNGSLDNKMSSVYGSRRVGY